MAEGNERAPEGEEIHRQLIAAASDISGTHEGRRALHAKGVWAEATFTGTPEGAAISSIPHLAGEAVPCLVRFSKASGNPNVHDGARDGGGLAAKLRPPGAQEWDIVCAASPVFVARTVDDFLELLRLRKPDPETGQPDMEALGAYLGDHPEAVPAIQAALGSEPPASFASVSYFSPHAFRLTGDAGQTWVRWRWSPPGGEERLPDEEATALGRDYLRDELERRVASGPVAMDLVFQIRGEGDSLTDPTEPWPDDREAVVAGRLEVTAVIDDPERDGHIEVFDPMRLPDGVEPSDDEILHARPRAYSVSAYRRLGE